MDPKLISCIILSSDSHINKGNSVFHCIFSLLQQNYKNIEIILIENSHKKNKKMINLLQKKVRSWNRLRQYPVDFKIVDNPHHLPYGKARTRGASKAKGEIFVFTEDDTILVTKNAFSQIAELSKQFDCGFGAQRLWTKDKKFQKSSKSLLDEPPTSTYFKSLLKISGNPPSNVRGSRDVRLQRRSLIANFGFIKRKIFQDVGGFIAFPGRGFDDDHMMFKLYKGGYKHTLLDTIQVVHINHPQRTNCVHNLPYYFAELVKSGYYWFETIQLFLCNTNHDQILIPLKNVHYDERIKKAFNEYLAILPLDLRDQNVKFYNSWKANNQLSILDFSQELQTLRSSDTLDKFIKTSHGDFDNLASLISAAKKNSLIQISKNGKLKSSVFRFTQAPDVKQTIQTINPTVTLNQFPCDEESRKKRYDLLKERYPFCEYLSFAIIGDDDLLSAEFATDYWAWPIVIEKDNRINRAIKKTNPRVRIVEEDVVLIPSKRLPPIKTFITDPPYTLHGSLSFILAGLSMLEKTNDLKEFYVVLNSTMLGKHLEKIQRILSKNNVLLHDVRMNFSHYRFPKHFSERRQANAWLEKNGINSSCLQYSSSSNLYIFRTRKPNLRKISEFIDPKKIYNHYL